MEGKSTCQETRTGRSANFVSVEAVELDSGVGELVDGGRGNLPPKVRQQIGRLELDNVIHVGRSSARET